MPLPSNVGTGTVTGNFSTDIEGVDLTTWRVTLKPSQRQFIDATSTPPSIPFLKEAYIGRLDEDGNLHALELGEGGADLPFEVPATNDADLNPLDFTYQVVYTFPGLTTKAFYIEVPEGGTVNLVTENPVQQSNGALIVQGIPAGGADGYILAKDSNADYDTVWIPAPTGGGGGGGAWGSITGTLSAQTDLQTALNGKSATGHTHAAANVTDFSEAVDDRVNALLVEGANVTLTYNDVANTLTVAASGGGGGGAVDSVNGETGIVVLDAADVGARPDTYVPAWSEVTSKPAVIAAGADEATARSAIGAGTSNLAIGTTGTTAMAGNKTAADLGGIVSNVTGIPGAFVLPNIVGISQVDYDALTDPETTYPDVTFLVLS